MLNPEQFQNRDGERAPEYTHSPYSDLSIFSFDLSQSASGSEMEREQPPLDSALGEAFQALPVETPAVQIREYILDIDGFAALVVERRPQNVIVETPVVYLPGYLEGLDSNEVFLRQFDDRVVFALQVSAGIDRFEAYRKVLEEFVDTGNTPDLVTHSMGAFVLDHDFLSNPEDAELFRKIVLITPPGFIQGDSITRLLAGYVGEVWQSFSARSEDFRLNSKALSLREALSYIRSGIRNTIREAFHVPKVDLTPALTLFLAMGKEVHSILTTDDKLLPGDKTRDGLVRSGLTDEKIEVLNGTHIPHVHSPEATANAVKRRLDS